MSTVTPQTSRRKHHSSSQTRVRKWLASTVGLLTLLIAWACLWCALPGSGRVEAVTTPSEVRQYETKRISRIVPFDWALARNPAGDRDLQFGEVIHPKQWRLLKLVAPKKGGGTADVEMARPLTWLYSQWQAGLAAPDEAIAEDEDDEDSLIAVDDAQLAVFDPQQLVGRTVYISVPECGIDGHAKVLVVEDCPNLKPRPGPDYQLVTATFKHRGAKVVDVHVAGLSAPIGSTPNHPFWSEDKQQFVRADTLQPGEHLRQADGSLTTVTAVIARPGTHNVYNLEVHLDHVYHVANNGVLVHNSSLCPWDIVDPKYVSRVRAAFDGTPERIKLAKDLVVYRRVADGMAAGGSRWFALRPYASPESARRLLALPTDNTAGAVQKFIIPKGTEILRGKAANMSNVGVPFGPHAAGGGIQIYLPNLSSVIPGV